MIKYIVTMLLWHQCVALYEDQAGKFDWRHQYVGQSKLVRLIDQTGPTTGRRIIIATAENVLAMLNARTGELGWRQVFESGDTGRIDDLLVTDQYVVAVLGSGSYVRAFHLTMGSLVWEAALDVPCTLNSGRLSLIQHRGEQLVSVLAGDRVVALQLDNGIQAWSKALPNSDTVQYSQMAASSDMLMVMGVTLNSHITVVKVTSEGAQQSQDAVPAAWLMEKTQCDFVGADYFVCLDTHSQTLHVLSLGQPDHFRSSLLLDLGVTAVAPSLVAMTQPSGLDRPLMAIRSTATHLTVAAISHDAKVKVIKDIVGGCAVQLGSFGERKVMLTLTHTDTETLQFKAFDLEQGDEITEVSQSVVYPHHHGYPQQLHGFLFKRKDVVMGFRMLVISSDHSLMLFQQHGKVAWVREEAVANIVAVEMVDLPVSRIMAKMEDEFKSNGDDLLGMFVRRFSTQLSQVQEYLMHLKQHLRMPRQQHGHQHSEVEVEVEADTEASDDEDEEYLTRDDFNIHKMIVAVTASGKVFGMDSLDGKILWRHLIPSLVPFKRAGREVLPLFIQRTTSHFPHHPQATIVGRHKRTGQGLIFSFHPISGMPIEGMPADGLTLPFDVLQMTLMAQNDEQFLRPLLLLDTSLEYHVYPESCRPIAYAARSSLYMFVSSSEEGALKGYNMASGDDIKLYGQEIWTVNLHKDAQVITNVVGKRQTEHVHSQGIVLGDRSVLYKYLNPNIVVVTAEGVDNQQKGVLNVYLVDAVSGQLVFHCSHKKSKGPVHVVHSENWVLYDYWNQKHRRTELAVLELYEGIKQSNATAFSSLYPPPLPLVMRQAYIFPAQLSTMAATITEKGITSKHVLMALTSGGILDLPKALLDPRRPEIPTQDHREEGLIPYMPELPRPFEATINYNQSVFNLRGIHTSPAGLESTSLVLCYGLDLYHTRVMPSKMFDVLKEDFDYFFIACVLLGMILVSIASQKLAARKALNRAWK